MVGVAARGGAGLPRRVRARAAASPRSAFSSVAPVASVHVVTANGTESFAVVLLVAAFFAHKASAFSQFLGSSVFVGPASAASAGDGWSSVSFLATTKVR